MPNDEAFKRLVERYADGRQLCNCREGYCDAFGNCPAGCSSNQIMTKYEIAEKVLAELEENDGSDQC